MENLAIERHTRLASVLCDAIEAGTSEGPSMSSDRLKGKTMCFEEATVSNIWEIGAMVEGLEKTGKRARREFSHWWLG